VVGRPFRDAEELAMGGVGSSVTGTRWVQRTRPESGASEVAPWPKNCENPERPGKQIGRRVPTAFIRRRVLL